MGTSWKQIKMVKMVVTRVDNNGLQHVAPTIVFKCFQMFSDVFDTSNPFKSRIL
jgi:hypothetical protein